MYMFFSLSGNWVPTTTPRYRPVAVLLLVDRVPTRKPGVAVQRKLQLHLIKPQRPVVETLATQFHGDLQVTRRARKQFNGYSTVRDHWTIGVARHTSKAGVDINVNNCHPTFMQSTQHTAAKRWIRCLTACGNHNSLQAPILCITWAHTWTQCYPFPSKNKLRKLNCSNNICINVVTKTTIPCSDWEFVVWCPARWNRQTTEEAGPRSTVVTVHQ